MTETEGELRSTMPHDGNQRSAAPRKKPKASLKRAFKEVKVPLREKRAAGKLRTQRPFPSCPFEDALIIGETIHKIAGGAGKARRITLFEDLDKSPDSGPSRQMVTNSSQYGVTTGGYHADYLELTEDGAIATDPDSNAVDRLRARFRLAIERHEWFRVLYETFSNGKLPSASVMRDLLRDKGLAAEWLEECGTIFIVNAQFLGLLREIAGSERLLTLDHAVEDLARTEPRTISENRAAKAIVVPADSDRHKEQWDTICFYVTPIGDEGTAERRHADLFTGSIIEPAVQPLGLKVVRADQIGESGMIATQIMQHLKYAKLVIADMSLSNPNVFYEMALRHAARRPIVQIICKADKLPFDLNQVRSVVIDTTDIYSLVPKLDVIRAEITTQARKAIDDPDSVSNPITVFFPQFFDGQAKASSLASK